MRPLKSSAHLVALVGGLCLVAALAVTHLDPGKAVRNLREDVFDLLLILSPRSNAGSPVVVIDIGRDALEAIGPWPWPRDRLAELIDKIADAGPAALAINILLSAREPPESDPADERLAKAIARAPTVLAMVLDPAPNPGIAIISPTPLATQGEVEVPDMLQMPGVVLPAPALAAHAKGLGVISLPTAEGQPVRSVYLLAAGANSLFAGFAVETLRAAEGGSTLIASAPPQVLRIGTRTVPLPADGSMRLHFTTRPSGGADGARRSPASGAAAPQQLEGKIVMLGASAPEAGGLRLTPADPFMPSVEIEAEAVEQILSGHIPMRVASMDGIEAMVGAFSASSGSCSIKLAPGRAAIVILLLSPRGRHRDLAQHELPS